MIFVLDATAFLMLSKSQTPILERITTEILDVVVAECHHPKYLDAYQLISLIGLKHVATDSSWLHAAIGYRSPKVSFQDCLTLHYAKSRKRILVTEARSIMSICNEQNIQHSTFREFIQNSCS